MRSRRPLQSPPPLAEIPTGTKKCCQACFQRISRKISLMSSGANSPASSSNVADSKADSKDSKDSKDAVDAKGDKGSGGEKASSAAGAGAAAASASPTWADAEVEAVKAELRAHGRNWPALAAAMKGSKTAEQCKKFFYENRKKCGLDKIILEYKRVSEWLTRRPIFKGCSIRSVLAETERELKSKILQNSFSILYLSCGSQ